MNRLYFFIIAALLLVLFCLGKNKETYGNNKWIVYGTMGCGWTRKQLDHLNSNGVGYTFIECDKGGCPPEVKAYPTSKLPGGDMKVGFTSVN